MADKVALITGVTGQDGVYLSELLLGKGYQVHGTRRRSSTADTSWVERLNNSPLHADARFFMHVGDVTDSEGMGRLIEDVRPAEIYNLAAQSHVQVSFDSPEDTVDAAALGALRLLEVLRSLALGDRVRFYQASTSEIFGSASTPTQNENTPFNPRSPYGVAKLFAHRMTVTYREAYGFHASCGILFNHESPLRGETFVTRKITRAAAAVAAGARDVLDLGNLDARRDWGHARDFVEGMWMMLQQPEPDDYVLATGQTHSVREFVETAFAEIGIAVEWRGKGLEEEGIDAGTGRVLVKVDPRYFRPADDSLLCGDATKACARLGWRPRVGFEALVKEMVAADVARCKGVGL